MKVLFLGTSHGAPEEGKHCQSILVETNNGSAYLVDAGAPVMDIFVNMHYDMTKLKAVFLTHLHGDHLYGIVQMLDLAGSFAMRYDLFVPEQRGIDCFRDFAWMQFIGHTNDRITYKLTEPGCIYDDGNMKVTAFHNDHMELKTKKSFGFLMEADGERVYITGDMSHHLERDIPPFLYEEAVDLLISECAHFPPELLYEKIKNCKVKQLAIVHISFAAQEKISQGLRKLSYPVCFPCDGDLFYLGGETR